MAWQGLLAILKEAAQDRIEYRTAAPTACPRCGEPLETGPNGDLHCRWDGWLQSRNYLRL